MSRRMYDRDMIEADVHKFLKSMPIAISTSYHYRHYICSFLWWCVDSNIDAMAADPATVRDWFDSHQWSSSTMHFAAAALRLFYRWKYGETHPLCRVRVKRVDPGPQRTLTEAEVAILLSSIDTTKEKGVRDLALVTLMIDTGLRAAEMCNIQMRKLNLREKKLSVIIKGGRWGEAVYFDYTAACLNNWLAIRPHIADSECDKLFVSLGGRTWGQAMTRHGLRITIERLAENAGLEHMSPHALRRTFATLATEYGAPTRMVQVAGRWKDIRMVETYTKALDPRKLAAYSVVNRLMGVTEREQQERKA